MLLNGWKINKSSRKHEDGPFIWSFTCRLLRRRLEGPDAEETALYEVVSSSLQDGTEKASKSASQATDPEMSTTPDTLEESIQAPSPPAEIDQSIRLPRSQVHDAGRCDDKSIEGDSDQAVRSDDGVEDPILQDRINMEDVLKHAWVEDR
ncbi:hypothetical protein TruAng_001157 [Truncatella angustata]|nr:hypothetical protein TruAng_001157 [Truncatella angustata]